MRYYKLKKQADFDKLFKKGKRMFAPSLTVIYAPSKKTTMGVSVGKRHGKSVKRNRIKRLLREAFRLETDALQGNYAFVLIPKVAEEYTFSTFQNDIRWILKKAQL